MTGKQVGKHVFSFNPLDNGGEQLLLTTTIFDNGDGELYTNQELALQSYGNSASINLFGTAINTAGLRQLADELDELTRSVYVRNRSSSEEIPS
jgi:hypothetical protein